MNKRGFSLIELLVVIAIIAVLVAFGVTNYVGVRARARDVKEKTELSQIKNALRLYYSDYAVYPGPSTTVENDFNGCGSASPPAWSCLTTCSGRFAAGGAGCDTVYMKLLPPQTEYVWKYRQTATGDDFCLWTSLENSSDTEISKSQSRCNSTCSTLYGTEITTATDYVVCAD